MNKAMKASLLSSFVFPGMGHLFLKKYLTGTALISVSMGALYFLVSTGVERALNIIENIQLGEVQPDIEVIFELVSNQSAGGGSRLTNIASIVLFFTWLIGIVDSYLAGREKKTL